MPSWLERWYQRWKGPSLLFLFGAAVLTAMGLVAIVGSLFTDTLAAGPKYVIQAPSVDPTAPGIVSVTPVALPEDALRIGWTVASALVLFGVATMLFTAAQVLIRGSDVPLFGPDMTTKVTLRTIASLLAIGVGYLTRDLFLAGRIAEALDIESIGLPSDDDYGLFVFEVPFLALLFIAMSIGWIWNRGEELQTDMEDIV